MKLENTIDTTKLTNNAYRMVVVAARVHVTEILGSLGVENDSFLNGFLDKISNETLFEVVNMAPADMLKYFNGFLLLNE